MIKRILKNILPVAFLKACFLVYNKIRIQTIDRLLYPEYRIAKTSFRIWREDYPFRSNSVDITALTGRPEYEYMKAWMDWTQEEYLLEFKQPCWIEPDYGWAIISPNKLIYESLAFSRTAHQKKPDLTRFYRKRKTQTVDQAISLRDSGEENYFHFYNDVLAKIFFLKEEGINLNAYTVIISSNLWNKPYFRFYFENSSLLKSLNWLVQDDQYIQCRSVIFCKPMTHKRSLWTSLVIDHNASGQRKIFLTRSKSRLRFIENSEDVHKICRSMDLEIVDTDELSFEQQRDLFSQSSFIAGIHGAGLTNMIYRKRDCRILEIFPPPDLGYLPYHYVLLASMKSFEYRALIAEKGRVEFSGGFYLDSASFEKELKTFLWSFD